MSPRPLTPGDTVHTTPDTHDRSHPLYKFPPPDHPLTVTHVERYRDNKRPALLTCQDSDTGRQYLLFSTEILRKKGQDQ